MHVDRRARAGPRDRLRAERTVDPAAAGVTRGTLGTVFSEKAVSVSPTAITAIVHAPA